MDDQRPASPAVAGLLAFELASVLALLRLGRVDGFTISWAHLGRWLHDAPTADALIAVVRLVALCAACWLLGSTVLYIAARASRVPAAARVAGWAAPPGIRRRVDRVLAVSIVASATLSGGSRLAVAEPPSSTAPPASSIPHVLTIDHRPASRHPDEPVSSGRSGRAGGLETAPAPAPLPAPTTFPAPTTTAPRSALDPARVPTRAPAPAGGPSERVVEAGDSLWTIAASRLYAATGRTPAALSDDEIARYWVRVVAVNRERLRSGNPSLIFPGELVALPPVA